MWRSKVLGGWWRKRDGPNALPAPDRGGNEGDKLDSFRRTLIKDEHFVPTFGLDLEEYIARKDLTAIHHVVRYQWAKAVLSKWDAGGRLLDLGCGAGYGAFLLAEALPDVEVLGVDYDEQAVREAAAAYRRPNLSFRVADPLVWSSSIGDDEFKTIVAFDVLEHVRHREIFLEGVVAHLRPAGRFLFSTPSGMPDNNMKPDWPQHQIEYGTASLYDFLRRYFREVLRSDEEHFPERALFTKLHERGISYVLKLNPVICSEPIRIENPYRTSPSS